MKKRIIIPMLVLSMILIFTLAGCKREEVVEEPKPTPPIENPVDEVDEDEKESIINEFQALIESDKDITDIKSFVDENIGKLGQLEGNMMIDSLETLMEENIDVIIDKLYILDKTNELMEIAELELYFPEEKIDSITKEDLRNEVSIIYDNMYKLINVEGSLQPIIDYSKLKTYNNNITDEWKQYLAIRAMDSDDVPFVDAGMRISFESLADRIIKTENFLNNYIDGARQEQMLRLYNNKLRIYMKGLPNTSISDNKTKVLFDDVMVSYKNTSNMDGYVTSNIITQYIDIIEANNNIIDDEILSKADTLIEEAVRILEEYK